MWKMLRSIGKSIKVHMASRSKKYSNREVDKRERINKIRESRNRMREDLMVGYRLMEITIEQNDAEKFLYGLSGLTHTQILELYKKYRGFRIGEHPQIYNVSKATRHPN